MDPATTCALCPKLCRYACPVATACGDETAVPTAMGALILLRRAGALGDTPEQARPLYRCTSCGACAVPCDLDVDVPAFLGPERERVWSAGAAPAEVVRVADRVARGDPPDGRAGHHRDLEGPRFGGRGVVLWPGCALVGASPEAVERTRRLLERVLGVEVLLPPADAPACCGDPLRAAGDRSRYLGHRAWVSSALRGAERVVTGCACCQEALPAGAVHVVDVLGVDGGGMELAGSGGPVAFHDPCRLARPEDRSGAPRALLAAATGSEVLEFVDRGVETGCCGAGDSFALFAPADGLAVARHRLRDPVARDAGTVVTACSRCAVQLAEAAPEGVVVADLAEFLDGLGRRGAGRSSERDGA